MNALNRWHSLLTVVAALGLAALACGPNVSSPTPPGSPIPVTTQAAGELEGVWATAVANAQDGKVTAVMTEAQLTSYAALKLSVGAQTPITDTQIYLRNGKMLLYAKITTGGVSLPAVLTLSVVPTASGAVSITIDDANIGPLPVPSSLRDSLSSSLNDVIAQQVAGGNSNFKVTDVAIGDGKMTVTATLTH